MWRRLKAAITPQIAGLMVLLAVCFLMMSQKNINATESLERRAEEILSRIDGAGQVQMVIAASSSVPDVDGLILKRGGNEAAYPTGALVIAEGAADPYVCMQITQAVCALLGLPASAVCVSAGK